MKHKQGARASKPTPQLREVVVAPSRELLGRRPGGKQSAFLGREALAAVFSALRAVRRERIQVERVARVGGGRSRSAWLGRLSIDDADATTHEWVALVPHVQLGGTRASSLASTEVRTLAEGRLLVRLRELGLRFVPRVHALVRGITGGVLVMDYAAGRPVLLSGESVNSIARIAARLHGVDGRSLRSFFKATSRRDHAEEMLGAIQKRVDGDVVIAAAHAFAAAHLPHRAPAVLIHHDLRATNIRLDRSGTIRAVGWERARLGDPAADLAAMEPATNRWSHSPDELDALIRAYRKAGGDRAVEPEHVRVYELARLVVEYRRLMANHPTRRRAGAVRSRIVELLDLFGKGRPRNAPIKTKSKTKPPAARAPVSASSELVEPLGEQNVNALFDDWT